MNNFVLGMRAVFESVLLLLEQTTKYQVFWGFLIGFFVSTVFYGFLVTDRPRQVPSVLFEDKAKSFQRLYNRQDGQSYHRSFYEFSQRADRLKAVFLLAVLFLILLILITITTF